MAIYDFEAPDGRIFSFESDTMPTDEELDAAYDDFLNNERKVQNLSPLPPELQAQPAGNYSKGVLGAGLRGFGEGALLGVESVLNGATLGGYGWLNRKIGGDMKERQQALRQETPAAYWAGQGLELAGNIVGGGGAITGRLAKAGLSGKKLASAAGGLEGTAYGLTGSDTLEELPGNLAVGTLGGALSAPLSGVLLSPLSKGANFAANRYNRYVGNRNLISQLTKGTGFTDVRLGDLSPQRVREINNLRKGLGQPLLENNQVTVPENVVKKLYNKRIVNDEREPKEFVSALNEALYSPEAQVSLTKFPQNQASLKPGDDLTNITFSSVNPKNTSQNVVKSAYKVSNEDVADVLFGKSQPEYQAGSLQNRFGRTPTDPSSIKEQRSRSAALDDLLPSNQSVNNIALDDNIVNPKVYSRDFMEALADVNKRKTMRNAVMAGEEALAERARTLKDLLEMRKNGLYNPMLEASLRTPELAKARNAYSDFFAQNGGMMLDSDKIAQYYNQHPVALETLQNMRSADPRAFDNVVPGSLTQFDMLKRNLRKEAGISSNNSVSKKSAAERAENDLKRLMESEFPGFRDINQQYARARTVQNLYENKLGQGLTSVGGAVNSPFWSGLSAPLASAGAVGSALDPNYGLSALGGLGGKVLLRAMRRRAGRNIADSITPEALSNSAANLRAAVGAESTDWLNQQYPTLSAYLSGMFAAE